MKRSPRTVAPIPCKRHERPAPARDVPGGPRERLVEGRRARSARASSMTDSSR